MAIDTKTTAGGVVVLILSGTGGYLATNAAKGEGVVSEGRSGSQGEEVPPKIKEKIKDSKFLLIEEQNTPDTEWEKLATATKTKDSSATKEQLKQFCKDNLEKTYSKETEENFKESIKKCTTLVTFKERADQLGIELIKNEGTTPWKNRFEALTEPKAKKLAQESGETITWPENQSSVTSSNLQTYCQTIEALNWITIKITVSNDNSIEREWNNYLKGCAKQDNVIENFWTGK